SSHPPLSQQDGRALVRQAHNLEHDGESPSPATKFPPSIARVEHAPGWPSRYGTATTRQHPMVQVHRRVPPVPR
nr:hypothetical protein [Candidatus Sigynarchaeum springense]